VKWYHTKLVARTGWQRHVRGTKLMQTCEVFYTMTTVVSADDWPLFLLCLLLATVLFFLGPVAFTAVAVASILLYMYIQNARAGYKSEIESDAPSSGKREQ
jgi:hypothetical protein